MVGCCRVLRGGPAARASSHDRYRLVDSDAGITARRNEKKRFRSRDATATTTMVVVMMMTNNARR